MPRTLVPAEQVFQIGQSIKIQRPGYDQEIVGILNEIGQLYIGIAIDNMTNAAYANAPEVDTPLLLCIAAPSCLYLAKSAFRGVAPLPDKIWFVNKPDAAERQQLREYIRIPALLPIHLKTQNVYGTFNNATETTTLDISGGGLCFAASSPLPVASKISLVITDLPGFDAFPVEGKIIRCTEVITDLGHTVYHIGVSFDGYLSSPLQARLLRAITTIQRQALSRGMGIK